MASSCTASAWSSRPGDVSLWNKIPDGLLSRYVSFNSLTVYWSPVLFDTISQLLLSLVLRCCFKIFLLLNKISFIICVFVQHTVQRGSVENYNFTYLKSTVAAYLFYFILFLCYIATFYNIKMLTHIFWDSWKRRILRKERWATKNLPTFLQVHYSLWQYWHTL